MPDRQLLLLRHAKAEIGEHELRDIDRPLAARGRRAAERIGRYLAEHDLVPDLVLCSPARRTRETWEIAARALPPVKSLFPDSLYDFGDGSALLDAIRKDAEGVRRLLLVTHNPATQALALRLSGSAPARQRRQMAEKYPTAGLAVFTFPGRDWAQTAAGAGHLAAFIRPRDLMEE
ncbi:SixA phosphatase family protein [Aestuariivirga sp.]|jgi:phosphohistidine phosphatase|uniref:SixA phosphatase family protein n=1 Tax=Aestuariivirga sp. TaxID=2650926 RepID=UPI00378357D9